MIKSWKISLIHSGKFLIFVSLLCFGFLKWQVVHIGLKNYAMAKSIKSGFCSQHLLFTVCKYYAVGICAISPTAVLLLKFKIGICHGVFGRKIDSFCDKTFNSWVFFSITYQSEFCCNFQRGSDHVPTTFKNQLPKSEMQVLLTLLFFPT